MSTILNMLASTINSLGSNGFSLDSINLIATENINQREINNQGDS